VKNPNRSRLRRSVAIVALAGVVLTGCLETDSSTTPSGADSSEDATALDAAPDTEVAVPVGADEPAEPRMSSHEFNALMHQARVAREKAEREAAEQAEREQAEREAAEQAAREKAEREAAEQAEREAAAAAAAQLERVRGAQTRLKELGWYASSIDGLVGPGTTRAIEGFQRAAGLKVTGKVSDTLLSALARKDAPRAPAPKPATTTTAPKPSTGTTAPKPSTGTTAPKPSTGTTAPKPPSGTFVPPKVSEIRIVSCTPASGGKDGVTKFEIRFTGGSNWKHIPGSNHSGTTLYETVNGWGKYSVGAVAVLNTLKANDGAWVSNLIKIWNADTCAWG
jgi:peptidoglycan hydrolase-like protein with peptidoglycan-binding domain